MHSIHNGIKSFDNSFVVRRLFLAVFWVFGLLIGLYISFRTPILFFSLMRTYAYERVSILGLVLIVSFPLILSAIAVRFSTPLLFLPVAFLKAFCFSYCSNGIVLAFGSAGWLVRWLFVFSDSCAVIVLFWFWIRNIAGDRGLFTRDFFIGVLSIILFCCIDYFVVSPFTAILFKH